MALIKCNECGKDISDSAISCPHCGNPHKQEVSPYNHPVLRRVIIFIMIFIMTTIFALYACYALLSQYRSKTYTGPGTFNGTFRQTMGNGDYKKAFEMLFIQQ